MNVRINRSREFIFDKHHHLLRRKAEEAGLSGIADEMKAAGLRYQMLEVALLRREEHHGQRDNRCP